MQLLKEGLAVDLQELKKKLPLEELSVLVPERIWRLKATQATRAMKEKRGDFVKAVEGLLAKESLDSE